MNDKPFSSTENLSINVSMERMLEARRAKQQAGDLELRPKNQCEHSAWQAQHISELETQLQLTRAALEDQRRETTRLRIENESIRVELTKCDAARAEAVRSKNGAYSERNQCVALIAKMALALGWRAGIGRHPDNEAWEDDWRTIVFVYLPTGQTSWHFHDSERHLINDLPAIACEWDGHGTTEKYERVQRVATP